jgi:hypothetical protein
LILNVIQMCSLSIQNRFDTILTQLHYIRIYLPDWRRKSPWKLVIYEIGDFTRILRYDSNTLARMARLWRVLGDIQRFMFPRFLQSLMNSIKMLKAPISLMTLRSAIKSRIPVPVGTIKRPIDATKFLTNTVIGVQTKTRIVVPPTRFAPVSTAVKESSKVRYLNLKIASDVYSPRRKRLRNKCLKRFLSHRKRWYIMYFH